MNTKNLLVQAVFTILSLICVSCSDTPVDTMFFLSLSDKPVAYTLSVNEMQYKTDYKSGTKIFEVKANEQWVVSTSVDWLSLSTTSGNDNGTISISIQENKTATERSATIVVSGLESNKKETIKVEQTGRSLSIQIKSVKFDASGGSQFIQFISDGFIGTTHEASWLTCEPSDSQLKITALPNTSNNSRKAVITVSIKDTNISQEIEVTQDSEVNQIMLWEGEIVADNFADQRPLFSDGGAEFKDVKVGQILHFYIQPIRPDEPWFFEVFDGHWTGEYANFTNDENEMGRPLTDLDANGGFVSVPVTQKMLDYAFTSYGWGGVFVLNGDNILVKKVSLVENSQQEKPSDRDTSLSVYCTEKKTYLWDSQVFINFPKPLKKGVKYKIQMDVRGNLPLDPHMGQLGPDAIQPVVQDNNSTNRDEWGGPADLQYFPSFALTTNWVQNVKDCNGLEFVTDGAFPYSRLLINLGYYVGIFYIDNIRAVSEDGKEYFCIDFESAGDRELVEDGWMNLLRKFTIGY